MKYVMQYKIDKSFVQLYEWDEEVKCVNWVEDINEATRFDSHEECNRILELMGGTDSVPGAAGQSQTKQAHAQKRNAAHTNSRRAAPLSAC
jgi:hypothetical protein